MRMCVYVWCGVKCACMFVGGVLEDGGGCGDGDKAGIRSLFCVFDAAHTAMSPPGVAAPPLILQYTIVFATADAPVAH